MASGNHTYNGNWADLPQAPTNSSKAMAVAVTAANVGACTKMSA